MEVENEKLLFIAEKYNFFGQMKMFEKTFCYAIAKDKRRLGLYTLLLQEKLTVKQFYDKMYGKEEEEVAIIPRPEAKYAHMTPVEYQWNKKKRWERVAELKALEIYKKGLRALINSSEVLTMKQKDDLEEEYMRVSNYIFKNIDSVL